MVWLHHIPSFVPKIFDEMVWHKSREHRKVYLTFDDGPVPGITDFVLEELAKRGMTATFFMVGDNVGKFPELAKSVYESGHAIGNHTYHHVDGFGTPDQKYFEEIRLCQDEIRNRTGFSPSIFRPPYGKITRRQFKEVSKHYQVVLWDVISGDYDPGQSPGKCLSKTKEHTKKGSIILFHDQQKTEKVIKAVLPDYLDFVNDQGFETAKL
ncbi:polysaccharide deacetylase family protein [Cecembia calidifontis]|jgi:peptidoglycan/xylan/chitin deacetylase (PgdA/CDA1 family)|uniref:Peptidoglycan/xylan/chitin deacetylase (PgdA/CDA1 family) n=1 Tax=Cecembia calidifontis TaxID=1187080 RepID=A0A4V2F731_9BACT|nr:polysaccharide deacetylase family protein [Cecembia calidifontis]RZS98399.1 peptidoglycan/xylan/chitin deacetylase (PgdA/CDA1 family) [Cecembia calidifontis]